VKRIVECIPNFSEGRRPEVVDALALSLTDVSGVALLDREMDAAHNRCVLTVAGDPEAVAAGVLKAVQKAAESIDLRRHRGEHPRMGAVDVIPFVPISGISMAECVELSVRVAEEIADKCKIPVYLYEQSARIPERRDLAHVRKGGFEAIRDEIGLVVERRPDFGPSEVHPSAGVVAVGARFPLIAYNVYLQTADLGVAQAIARAVRFSSGGLRFVKALGLAITHRNQVQVSMNLTNFESTPVFRAFEMVRREAERFGVAVASSEIVGLAPQEALNACSDYYLRLEGFSRSQILEVRLAEALKQEPLLDDYLSQVAAANAAPGGGNAAAMAGALGAALGEMVAGLTQGRKKYEAVEAEAGRIRQRLAEQRRRLYELAWEDSAAYGRLMEAVKLPAETEQQRAERSEMIEQTTRAATEAPLRTAQHAAAVLEDLLVLVESGNRNARSDAAAGASLANAALKSAQYNVIINTPGLKDKDFAERCRAEAAALAARAQQILARVDELMTR
jgi:glutamate formiminotransferase/formiminotetrahydrofolate cyclodeaminase